MKSRSHGSGQAGFSLLEALVASLVGLLAMLGILYLYKAQHKNLAVQGGMAEMRMNGQYTLNELQFHLAHAGLGLPPGFKNLFLSGGDGDLVVRSNPSKKGAPAAMDPMSTSSTTVFRIPRADTALFSGKAFAAALDGSGAAEAPIRSVEPRPGVPGEALISLARNRVDFPASTVLYPVDRVRLHRCTGIGADTAEGEFKVLAENPGNRPGMQMDSLALAEGIASIAYRWHLINGDSLAAPPGDLDSLLRIGIRVTARTTVKDPALAGDGYRKQVLAAKVAYRRAL